MITEFNSYMSNIDIDFFKELCLKHGELRHYKKNEFILHEGDACSFFGFILSGVVKYSCINRTENKPYNVGFSFPNEFIGDYPTCFLFQRIKAHLERETQRTGRKLTQREFVLGLIDEALEAAERQAVEDIPEPEEEQLSEEAGVSPCEAQLEGSDTQPQEEDVPAVWGA